MKHIDLATNGWPDYELLDSGDNKKLERFGPFVLIRPETQAIWKSLHPELWKTAKAEFRFDGGKGSWRSNNKGGAETWDIMWHSDARFTLRLTSFKHTGVFPEQAPNWEWTAEQVKALAKRGGEKPRVLNLFGYTGIASIVAAKHGAHVTHLDASKQSNTWAKENATLSEVPPDALRYITDDALSSWNAKSGAAQYTRASSSIPPPSAADRMAKYGRSKKTFAHCSMPSKKYSPKNRARSFY